MKTSNRAKAAEILNDPRAHGPDKVAWALDQIKPVKPLPGQRSLFPTTTKPKEKAADG